MALGGKLGEDSHLGCHGQRPSWLLRARISLSAVTDLLLKKQAGSPFSNTAGTAMLRLDLVTKQLKSFVRVHWRPFAVSLLIAGPSRLKSRSGRIWRWVGGAFVVGVVLGLALGCWVWWSAWPEPIQEPLFADADAIVILGGGDDARWQKGLEVARTYPQLPVVVTGDDGYKLVSCAAVVGDVPEISGRGWGVRGYLLFGEMGRGSTRRRGGKSLWFMI